MKNWADQLERAQEEARRSTAHAVTCILIHPSPVERIRDALRLAAMCGRTESPTGSLFGEADLQRLAASFVNAPGWEPTAPAAAQDLASIEQGEFGGSDDLPPTLLFPAQKGPER